MTQYETKLYLQVLDWYGYFGRNLFALQHRCAILASY